MRRRKLFIGVPLEPGATKRLEKALLPYQPLPMRWARPEHYHLTVLFIGYTADEQVGEICTMVEEAARAVPPFELLFDRVTLVPEQLATGGVPEMLWLTGEASQPLLHLREDLEERLGVFVAGKKSFRPHITLGRVRLERWSSLQEPPTIAFAFDSLLSVDTLTVFESLSGNDGVRYEPLGSYPLLGEEDAPAA